MECHYGMLWPTSRVVVSRLYHPGSWIARMSLTTTISVRMPRPEPDLLTATDAAESNQDI
jgi:hypothetical protein